MNTNTNNDKITIDGKQYDINESTLSLVQCRLFDIKAYIEDKSEYITNHSLFDWMFNDKKYLEQCYDELIKKLNK